jgi:hypothetical protein
MILTINNCFLFATELDCQIITQGDEFHQNDMDCVLCEVVTEVLYALAMNVSLHRVEVICD